MEVQQGSSECCALGNFVTLFKYSSHLLSLVIYSLCCLCNTCPLYNCFSAGVPPQCAAQSFHLSVRTVNCRNCFLFSIYVSYNVSYNVSHRKFVEIKVISATSKGQYPEDPHSFTLRWVRKIAKRDYCFVMSVCPSVRMYAWNNSAPAGRIFMKFYI
jgi:hypothetical protein